MQPGLISSPTIQHVSYQVSFNFLFKIFSPSAPLPMKTLGRGKKKEVQDLRKQGRLLYSGFWLSKLTFLLWKITVPTLFPFNNIDRLVHIVLFVMEISNAYTATLLCVHNFCMFVLAHCTFMPYWQSRPIPVIIRVTEAFTRHSFVW